MTVKPCPGCGREPTARAWHHGFAVTCDHCYDGTDDSSSIEKLHGFGITTEVAYNDWNEQVEDTDG